MMDNHPSPYNINDYIYESIFDINDIIINESFKLIVRKLRKYKYNSLITILVIINEYNYNKINSMCIEYLDYSYRMSKNNCNIKNVCDFFYKNGTCLKKYLKYDKNNNYTPSCIFNAEIYKPKGYCKILTLNGLIHSLHNNGPSVILLPIYTNYNHPWIQLYKQQIPIKLMYFLIAGYKNYHFILYDYINNNKYYFPFEQFGYQIELWTLLK